MAKAKKRASSAKKSVKKATKKTPKKAAKKAAKKAPRRSGARAPRVLAVDERQRLPKPRVGWRDLLEQLVETWRATPSLKVKGLTPSRLEGLGGRADKASDKERALVAAQQAKLRPVSDARLIAEADAWRAILEVNAALKYYGRGDPALAEAFAFLADALRSERGEEPRPPEPPA